VTFLVGGVVITTIDQLVTTNITPFVLVAMIVGTMFLMRPRLSATLFAAAYAAFFFTLGSGENSEVLLSNRTNALTAVAIGYALSWTMWRHFSIEIRQRRQIEAQSAELERVNRELQNMAFTDSLTGLPNRRYFDQAMGRELAAIERGGPPASVVEFDLDHFKEINDTCGHAAGDEILRQVAELVSGTVRKADMFARYGGEEFILLLPGTALDGAREAAEKLRMRIEEHVFLADGQKVNLTASFGVAELSMNPVVGYYRSVDHALYHAKQLGRNRVEASAPAVPQEMPPSA
jgi:diguanylate cyclase (GGDEF)-like protein